MEIRVLFFAQLRDLFGASEKLLQVREGASVEEVAGQLIQGKERSGIDWNRIKYAVNEEFSEFSKTLKDKDTLVLLPPVSGG